MKNERIKFGCEHQGGWTVKDPALVIKLGLVFDSYKEPMLDKLWEESYKKMSGHKDVPADWNKDDYFWSEIMVYKEKEKLMFNARFFTPLSNRTPIKVTIPTN